MEWIVAYMAQNKGIAQRLEQALKEADVLVKLRPLSRSAENTDDYYEVLVPEPEREEAQTVIIENGF